jgi:hypothetical protein
MGRRVRADEFVCTGRAGDTAEIVYVFDLK